MGQSTAANGGQRPGVEPVSLEPGPSNRPTATGRSVRLSIEQGEPRIHHDVIATMLEITLTRTTVGSGMG